MEDIKNEIYGNAHFLLTSKVQMRLISSCSVPSVVNSGNCTCVYGSDCLGRVTSPVTFLSLRDKMCDDKQNADGVTSEYNPAIYFDLKNPMCE